MCYFLLTYLFKKPLQNIANKKLVSINYTLCFEFMGKGEKLHFSL